MNPKLSQLIKISSSIVITGAIALEIFNLYLYLNHQRLPSSLQVLFWLGTVILIAHSIEAIIAMINLSRRDRSLDSKVVQNSPLAYGIYTFFVGFVSLQELFADDN